MGDVIDGPTLGSLYTGIGGWDLAFQRAGWRQVWQCEINPYRQRVLREHWPTVLLFPDGTDPGWSAPSVNCLVATCPTQTFAERGPVHEAVWQRIREARPIWIVIETLNGHSTDLTYARMRLAEMGFETTVVPAMYGCRDHGDAVNWVRLLLVGRRIGAPGTDLSWRILDGVMLATGELVPEANGRVMQRFGMLGVKGGDPWTAIETAVALGYPGDWLVDGDPAEMCQAVRETTAVPIALDVAWGLARPAWKVVELCSI